MSEVVRPAESVYNLLPRDEVQTQKPSRYMSKFRPVVLIEEKSVKDAMRTMGPAEVPIPSPDKYLKKHSKEPKSPDKSQCSREAHSCTMRKPPVPTRADIPPMGIRTQRNFLKTVTAVQVKPKPISVDTRKGHKQVLENSGLVPKYIKKKVFSSADRDRFIKSNVNTTSAVSSPNVQDYGEVPEYLQQRNEDEQRAQEEYDNYVKDQREQGAMKYLSDEERHAILEGLKKNWDQLHREYQGLSFVIDTMSKKSHKQRLEAAMKQLENDIQIFEKFKTIYVPKEH
ncbi:enkurin isoform X1 [Antennarius striatus]|uniref:enkurin isoform X1 n=1 Tax=Antennarius striatus TaxID=241820 RepID=UPI0035B00E02